ncbi:MAG: GNAT family N-acetyltransferase [Acidimicrobiia bacterium]|nr:GNAT family N-acetyltransferase [Acidimicrobiia bacterium]
MPDDRAAVEILLRTVQARFGFPPLSEEAWVAFDAGAGDAGWLVESSDGLAGFTHRRLHRGTMVGEMVLDGPAAPQAADLLIGAIRHDEGGSRVRLWASDPATTAAAIGAGAFPGRRLVRLQRPLPADPPPPITGVRIVPFVLPSDIEAYLAVANEAFRHHPESSAWTRETFDERAGRRWFDPGGLFLAWQEDRPIGACWTKLHDGGVGEIYSIAVVPEAGGRGLGRALVLSGFDYLATRRRAAVGMLWADQANEAAVSLYRRLGMDAVRERIELLLEG